MKIFYKTSATATGGRDGRPQVDDGSISFDLVSFQNDGTGADEKHQRAEQQHRIALEAAFGLKEEYGYKELEDALIKTYMSVGVKLNHKKAVSLITMLRNKRMIVQENGRKYTFMPDFHY